MLAVAIVTAVATKCPCKPTVVVVNSVIKGTSRWAESRPCPAANPASTTSSAQHRRFNFLLRASLVSPPRALGVGHEPVQPLGTFEPVRRWHLERGTDRHESQVQPHPQVRIHIQPAQYALNGEKPRCERVAPGMHFPGARLRLRTRF